MFVYRTKALHKHFSENAHFGKLSITQYKIFNYAQLWIFYSGSLLGYKTRRKPEEAKVFSTGSSRIIRITCELKKDFVITVATFLES